MWNKLKLESGMPVEKKFYKNGNVASVFMSVGHNYYWAIVRDQEGCIIASDVVRNVKEGKMYCNKNRSWKRIER